MDGYGLWGCVCVTSSFFGSEDRDEVGGVAYFVQVQSSVVGVDGGDGGPALLPTLLPHYFVCDGRVEGENFLELQVEMGLVETEENCCGGEPLVQTPPIPIGGGA